jgi:anaerobic magnesium-protoporphyrin IX monomethyl ester cyclase
MRVCLINPPRLHPKAWGKPVVYPPIGIAYVAAVLEKQHEVSIIDAPTEGWKNLEQIHETNYRMGLANEEIADRVKRWSPDIVEINIPFSGWSKAAFEVASVVKSVDRDIITVLDGLHPSARPVDCLSNPDIDFVVRGEPEYTMLELVGALEQGITEDLKKIEGIGFVKNGKTVITPPRPEIQDLDALPFPARHLLPMDIYFEAIKENPIRGEISKRYTIIITSRGCPHRCIFCSNHIVMGKTWRGRSPENVVDELEQIVNTYSIRQIDFFDENMTLIKKRVEDICDLIMERGVDIDWYVPNGVRADTLDEELLRKMSAAGCKEIRVAPESGVQRVVDEIIKKNLNLEDVEKAVVLAKKLGADHFQFSIATPLYGTELYEQAKRGGYLRENFSDEALAALEPLIETEEFTADDLLELCAQANVVNQSSTSDKLVKAIRHPKKALRALLGKMD